jgi:hypothetical protein
MTSKNSSIVLILVVVIAAALLLAPTIISSLGNAWNKAWSDLWGLFAGAGNYTGGTSVNFKVLFADGTSKDFKVEPQPYNILPLIITVEGKEITSVVITVVANLKSSSLTAWKTSTKQQIELYKKPDTTPKMSSTATLEKSGTTWPSGEIKTIGETTLAWKQIDDVVKTYGDGDWLLQVNVSVELTATLGGKDVISKASAPSGGVDFRYQSASIESFTVTVKTEPFQALRGDEPIYTEYE